MHALLYTAVREASHRFAPSPWRPNATGECSYFILASILHCGARYCNGIPTFVAQAGLKHGRIPCTAEWNRPYAFATTMQQPSSALNHHICFCAVYTVRTNRSFVVSSPHLHRLSSLCPRGKVHHPLPLAKWWWMEGSGFSTLDSADSPLSPSTHISNARHLLTSPVLHLPVNANIVPVELLCGNFRCRGMAVKKAHRIRMRETSIV